MTQINVTEPFLPNMEEYQQLLSGIWDRNWLTNHGPLVKELEFELKRYHRIESDVLTVANGGLGLQIILKALGVSGEVITTPFSYIATSSCPLWEGCSLVFADIEPQYLTIDPVAVEAAITPATEAILATHVFGNPCDMLALEKLAEKHGLALIYDAAHAFGVRYQGKSILDYGDASMVSTHATKLFHTVEGGFVVAKDSKVAAKIEWMRRFGHKGMEDFHGVGINAKLSELHAAMGLCVLNHLPDILEGRRRVVEQYHQLLEGKENPKFAFTLRESEHWNFAYYPVIYNTEEELTDALRRLEDNAIYARRYFYPALDTLAFTNTSKVSPESLSISSRIACLPLFPGLSYEQVEKIVACL